MNVVSLRAFRATGLAAVAILGVAVLAGAIRVLPWIVAPDVPFRVAWPFARALLAVGLETTFLCAPPIGWALSMSTLVERGEARALFAIGLSPARVVRSTVVPALGFAALAAIAALLWGREAAAPGRLARSLINESKLACSTESAAPRAPYIPFVGVTWLCFHDAPPRLSGVLPAGTGSFTAADLTISDDLRSLRFSDMRLLIGERGKVRLRAGEAHFRGLSPWGRASNLEPSRRALLLSLTGATLALLAGLAVLARSIAQRIPALLIGGTGPVAAVLVMSRLEQGVHAPWAYAWVPLGGLLGLLAAVVVATLSRRHAEWRIRG